MKKVRKSLALDVMDCQAMPKSKRKLLKAEKYSIKVKKKEICSQVVCTFDTS